MVTVMEPPQTVRPQTPPEAVGPAANQAGKLPVMIDVREVDFSYADTKSSTTSRCKCRRVP